MIRRKITIAKKKLEEPERWITVNGQHLPVYAGGRIGAPGQEESKAVNKAVKKADKEWEEYHAKQQAQDTLERKRNLALEKISKMKDLNEWDRNDLEDLYKDNGGAWIHSDAMERAIEAPLSGKKTSTEKSLRRNFDNMMRAWEDTAYTTESKEAKAFLEKEMKDYRDRFEANMKQWSGDGKKTASMDLGNGLRLIADISDPYKNYSEVERAKKVNREKQYADKKLYQYRKAAQEEKAKAQAIADAISAKTGIANSGTKTTSKPATTSRNAKYDTSRATKNSLSSMNLSELRAVAKKYGLSQKDISGRSEEQLRKMLASVFKK